VLNPFRFRKRASSGAYLRDDVPAVEDDDAALPVGDPAALVGEGSG
jgi:hypothetical protein